MQTADPRLTDVSTGISLATHFTLESARRWAPWALVGVLVSLLMFFQLANGLGGVTNLERLGEGMSGAQARQLAADLLEMLPQLLGWAVLSGLAGLAVNWVALALTINALRGRADQHLELADVLRAGLRTIALGLLLGLAFAAAIGLAALLTILLANVAAALAVLAVIGLIGGMIYVIVRLAFTSLAIFDGAGVREAIARSWQLSHGAFWRIVGWMLLGGLCAGLFGMVAGLVTSMLPDLVGVAIDPLVQAAITVFSTAVLGLLYESQRARQTPLETPDPSPESDVPVA